MKYKGYIFKRKVEDIFIYPFIILGRILAKFDRLKREHDIFFFFPFYHTGGAEKVHAQVVKAVATPNSIIYFTRKSVDTAFLDEFKETGCRITDISNYVDNPFLYFLKFIWRGKISALINKQTIQPIIFNGQSNFGYKISRWIAPGIRQVELIHSFNTFSWIRLPFLPFISITIMISKVRIEEHLCQYRKLAVPVEFDERISYIQNAIELPATPCEKNSSSPLKLLYVGRATPEKRPELFVEIAKAAHAVGFNFHFTMVGEFPAFSNPPPNLFFTGRIFDPVQLNEVYCQHHIVIIPSTTEGFPIVLMEAMARGCAVMATPVGDIPYHLLNEQNGFLFSSIDATIIIKESIQWLSGLNETKIQQLSTFSQHYAYENFGIEKFNQDYRAILQSKPAG